MVIRNPLYTRIPSIPESPLYQNPLYTRISTTPKSIYIGNPSKPTPSIPESPLYQTWPVVPKPFKINIISTPTFCLVPRRIVLEVFHCIMELEVGIGHLISYFHYFFLHIFINLWYVCMYIWVID